METIIAAIISAIVATLGVIITNRSLRINTSIKNIELNLKVKELITTTQKLANELEAVRQSQFSEIISKRTVIYPMLWNTIRQYTSNWNDEKKDILWVKEFLDSLNKIDAEGGVFFSQAVYEKFHALQLFLFKLKEQLSNKKSKNVNLQSLEYIDTIFRGQEGNPGLASFLKDDLGGYRSLSIQTRSNIQETKSKNLSISLKKDYHKFKKNIKNIFYKTNLCPPPAISFENFIQLKFLSQELNIPEIDLITQPIGLYAVKSISKKDPEFIKILETIQEFIAMDFLEEDDPLNNNGKIDVNVNLFSKGIIDDFSLIGIVNFAEINYQVDLADLKIFPPRFDSVLELAAIVYTRISKKK